MVLSPLRASLVFYAPNLKTRTAQLQQQMTELPQKRGIPDYRCSFTTDDEIVMLCPPEDLSLWQTTFCCDRTNRVSCFELRKLARSREEAPCRLEDGPIVDLDTCQKCLNESIASGWMVGVTVESRRPGHSVIVASRRKPELNAKPGVTAASAPLPW